MRTLFAFFILGLTVFMLLIPVTLLGDNMSDKSDSKVRAGGSDVTFDDFSWLTGKWKGTGFGGTFEESWSPAMAGSMIGTFKLVVEGKVAFYEFCTITIDTAGPTLSLKHFNPDMTSWEEKDVVVRFPFESCTANELRFDGLVYRKVSDDSLVIAVMLKNPDGKVSENVFNCSRISR